MTDKKVYLIMDEQEERHEVPWTTYHIETPKRLEVISKRLKESGLHTHPNIEHIERRAATEQEIQITHTSRYVNDIKSTQFMDIEKQEEFCKNYEDIYVNNNTWNRALLAAGSAIDITNKVVENKSNGIAFIRPPGHHASPDAGCGFCIFNNVVIAAKHAIKNGTKRVLILDFDVHAGQGTQECIENDDNIRLISIHRYEKGTFWPNLEQCGLHHKYKNTINVPLNHIGCPDSLYFDIFQMVVIPFIYDWKPELIVVSCGFDAALGDPEGFMKVTSIGFATMIRMMTNTEVPVAAILEGGYCLDAIADCAEHVVRALLGEDIAPIERNIPDWRIMPDIMQLLRMHKDEYKVFGKMVEMTEKIMKEKIDYKDDTTDYDGERTVCIPYDTRGLYLPFTDEKVKELKNEMIIQMTSLNQYSNHPTVLLEQDNVFTIIDEKVAFGKNARVFAQLMTSLYSNPLLKLGSIDQFDSSLVEFKDIDKIIESPFRHSPICYYHFADKL